MASGGASELHPLQDCEDLLSCIRLLEVAKFPSLEGLLPRAQEVPAGYFGAPSSAGDQVISVSHAWRNQAHPDPACQKVKLLGQLLSEISSESGQSQSESLFLFLDFVSIPQRPFQPDQQQRSVEEMEIFKKALGCMHKMYFYSDRIIHLPWEEVDIDGEGAEETMSSEALRGAEFLQIGDCVQVIRMEAMARESFKGHHSSCMKPQVHLFDQVVAVDGETIRSVAQLESLLAGDSQTCTLRHYPFGKYSEIPADSRGWVFLERFITMVKCAMMDEDTARCVVVTPSNTILQQILNGARVLREAARDRDRGRLKRALESFIVELQSKAFSPASTDKRELSQSQTVKDDREVVIGIMQDFVEQLAVQWEAEAKKQRSLGSRVTKMAKKAETYMVEWERFSDAYAAKLAERATANPWPVAVLVTVPLAVALPVLLWPYADPHGGWTSQAAFWVIGLPLIAFPTWISTGVFLAETSQLELSRVNLLRLLAWAASVTALTVAATMGISGAWGVFPVPFTHGVAWAVGWTCLPLLWWCIPKAQRASTRFRIRLAVSFLAANVVAGLYCTVVPLLNVAVLSVQADLQPLFLSCYLVLKFAFELLALRLSKILGADTMPCFVFTAALAYQVNLCVLFSMVTSWFLVGQQIAFDVLENCYHLYTLSRLDASESARSGQYIVASLALREFVELVSPATFLLIYVLIEDLRPRSNALLCGREEQEVGQTVYFLGMDIGIEFAVTCITYAILVKNGYRPLLLLRGLFATRFLTFLLTATVSSMFSVSMMHSHYGNDLSFKLLWVFDRGAEWDCGLTWRLPPEGAAAAGAAVGA